MAIDNFDLRIAIKEIEDQQSDMALRWVMLKMWLDKQQAAQKSVQSDVELPCLACGGEVGHRINCPYGIAFTSVPRR